MSGLDLILYSLGSVHIKIEITGLFAGSGLSLGFRVSTADLWTEEQAKPFLPSFYEISA